MDQTLREVRGRSHFRLRLLIDGLILIGFLIIATLVGTVFAPKTRGKSLEDIEMERYGEHVTSM